MNTPPTHRSRFGLSLGAFIVLAYGLAWLLALPLWLGDGLAEPLAQALLLLTMFVPTVAALIVVFFIEKPAKKARALGLVPLTPVKPLLLSLLGALLIPIVVAVGGLWLGSLLGVFPADFVTFKGFEQVVAMQSAMTGAPTPSMPVGALVAMQFVNVLIASLFVNLVPALGEEIGWRGWMLPKLLRFGPWPAIILSGVIWGLWHAPAVLLGYNYPGSPGWLALLAMVVMSTIMGGIFGWLRLRGGSVWPAALAHSSFNASATLVLVFIAENGMYDPLQANVTGWSGWILPAILLITIVVTGKFMPRTDARAAEDA